MNLLKSFRNNVNFNYSIAQKFFSSMSFKVIGTHNGTFHCDEALGCFLLKLLNKDAEIVRSRNTSILDKCDIVIDVGGVYDPDKQRYDHHQREFNHTMNTLRPEMPFHIKLSSAGLIYCHFGEEIIKKIVGEQIDKQVLPHIYKNIYQSFVQEVDGIDNGVKMSDCEPNYYINTNLSSRVKHLNKRWNETEQYDEEASFRKAMELTGNEFIQFVKDAYNHWWPARAEVLKAINKRFDVHKSGEIIALDEFVPFTEHLHSLEKDLNVDPNVKYVLYSDNDSWRIRAVPVEAESFESRCPLLEAWRGLREENLVSLGAIEGAVFVHSTGFIGGHRTYEGALDMAVKSLLANSK